MAVFCKIVMSQEIANTAGLLTRTQAANYLNTTVRWMHRAPEHGIPHVKLGRTVFFLISDLDAYIKRSRVSGEMR